MEQLSYAKQLLVQLNQQRSKGYLCDVIVVVQNALFRAHKNVLSASSSYFKSLLLHDNLLTLDTEMISPAVFKQVLDFIYTGNVTNPDHVTDQGVADLLTAASYLQVQHLTDYCHRRLRPSSSVRTPPTSSTNLLQQQQASNGHLSSLMPPYLFSNPRANHDHWWKTCTERRTIPKERHQRHHQGRDVSPKDEWPSLRPSAAGDVTDASSTEMMRDLGLDLTRKSPTEDLTKAERQQRAAARRRARALGAPGGSEGWLQRGAPLLNGHYGRRSLEEEARDHMIHGGHDGTSPPEEEEERAGDQEEEVSANHMEPRDGDIIGIQREIEGGAAACSYPQLPPGGDDEVDDEPAVGDNLYVCIPCGRGFSSSEQLNAHVDSHTAEELCMDVKVEEEEDVVTSRRPPCDFWRPHQAGGGNDPAAPDDDPGSGNAGVKDEEDEEENEEDDEAADPENHPEDASTTTKEELPEEAEEHSSHLHLPLHACSVCNQRYEDAASLRQHERSRHHWLAAGANATAVGGTAARASFPCALCGKLFTQRGTMTRHMRSHLGLKPFACQECGMRFTRQYRLTEHARVHSGEKPYECRLCGGRFTQQRNLVSHLRMHTLSAS